MLLVCLAEHRHSAGDWARDGEHDGQDAGQGQKGEQGGGQEVGNTN